MILKNLIEEIVSKTTEWENTIHELQRKCILENPDVYYLGRILNYVTDLQQYCCNEQEE